MKLQLQRRYHGRDYTIGSLYVDGEYFCDTLEDTDRGLTPNDVAGGDTENKNSARNGHPDGYLQSDC